MNTRYYMVIIKGEIKTSEIMSCGYNRNNQKWDVKFNNGKTYSYAYLNVEKLTDPEVLNPNMYRISREGREFFDVNAIYVFRSRYESYWHICFGNGSERDYHRSELNIVESCLTQSQSSNVFEYIKQIAGLSNIRNEETGEKLLSKRFDKISFVGNEEAHMAYNTAKDAKDDISDINKELRKLQFSTKYQFDVKMLNDNSDYAKILRYAEYLQETNNMSDGQMTFTSLMSYENDEVETREREIRDIINKIIDHNDIAEIKKFADYRNYMSYEIIINNDEVKDGKLSKQVGYNSGAGTQIPYTLILSAALSMLYNVRVNSVRLIFIDEPFEKMSDHNIKLMLDFFKNQNFQVIFCAPPNKLESIGSECGVIIPVLKISNDNMQIGEIKFHEQ